MELAAADGPAEVLTCVREQARERALQLVLDTIQRWLYLPDTGPVLITLAAVAANLLSGDPVWLLIVAPPGSGKTELLQSLASLPNVHPAGTLTEASLLSGSPGRERAKDANGGLLCSVGRFGIVVLKDFTSILSMNREQRGPLLAALREIHDGDWTRHIGVDGGRCLNWSGKCALIGGCTPSIDRHHGIMSSMGERFLFYRLPEVNADELAERALSHSGHQKVMRQELTETVSKFFEVLSIPQAPPDLVPAEREFLVRLSTLIVRCRSAVERDGYNREIELIPDAESPGRLASTLAQLLAGLKVIGSGPGDCHRLLLKTGLDCVPALRRRLIEVLAFKGAPALSTVLAEHVGHPTVTAVRRALEDLAGHGITRRTSAGNGKADLWELSEWAQMAYRAVNQAFPKSQEGL